MATAPGPTGTATRQSWWPSTPFARTLLGVGLLALAVRVLIIVLVDPRVPELGDASAYHLIAENLAAGRGYIRPFDLARFGLVVPTAEYPPLHTFVLSGFARVGLHSVESQRLALAVVGTGTVLLIGNLGRRIAGPTAGIVAAALAAVSPMMFLPDATLMSETLYGFLVALALVTAAWAAATPSFGRVAILGLVLGFAILTRPEAALLAVLLVVPLLWTAKPQAPMRRVGMVALAALGVAVVVLPWTVRNYSTFDEIVPVSNNFGGVLSGANCRLTYSGDSLGSWRSTFGSGDPGAGECFTGFNGRQPGFNEARAGLAQRRRGIEFISDHLSSVPKVMAARVLRTFGLFRPSQQIELDALEGRPEQWQRIGTIFEWVLYPFAVAGLVLLVRRRAPAWPLIAALISVIVGSALTYGSQRFRIGAEPTILIGAAVGLVAVVQRAPRSSGSAPPPGTATASR